MQPVLSPQHCSELYESLIDDALEFTQELGVRRIVGCHPNSNNPYFQAFSKKVYIDMGDTPGTKMGTRIQQAFDIAFQKGATKVVLWDGLAPQISERAFKEVYSRLDKASVVMGPAMDFSTYILGAKKGAPKIFEKVEWDTPKEFSSLVYAAQDANLEYYILPILQRLRTANDLPQFIMNLKELVPKNSRVMRNGRKVFEKLNLL